MLADGFRKDIPERKLQFSGKSAIFVEFSHEKSPNENTVKNPETYRRSRARQTPPIFTVFSVKNPLPPPVEGHFVEGERGEGDKGISVEGI